MTGFRPATMESHAIVGHACPKCGTEMLLARIGPTQQRLDLRRFECTKCEHLEIRVVKYCRPPQLATPLPFHLQHQTLVTR
jgi:ribosomal protein S27AE